MLGLIKKWLDNIFCKHIECRHIRDIGGDEQMHHYVEGGGLARSKWVCLDCKAPVYKNWRALD